MKAIKIITIFAVLALGTTYLFTRKPDFHTHAIIIDEVENTMSASQQQ